MTREAPTLRSRSSCPALPRKISGEAFTTKASGIPQFPSQVLIVYGEDVDTAAG